MWGRRSCAVVGIRIRVGQESRRRGEVPAVAVPAPDVSLLDVGVGVRIGTTGVALTGLAGRAVVADAARLLLGRLGRRVLLGLLGPLGLLLRRLLALGAGIRGRKVKGMRGGTLRIRHHPIRERGGAHGQDGVVGARRWSVDGVSVVTMEVVEDDPQEHVGEHPLEALGRRVLVQVSQAVGGLETRCQRLEGVDNISQRGAGPGHRRVHVLEMSEDGLREVHDAVGAAEGTIEICPRERLEPGADRVGRIDVLHGDGGEPLGDEEVANRLVPGPARDQLLDPVPKGGGEVGGAEKWYATHTIV